MDLDNPGIEEEEDEKAPFSKRKRLHHFDQMMAGLTHFDNETLASFLGHFQAYSAPQNVISQEKCCVVLQVVLVLAGLETIPLKSQCLLKA